MGYNPVTDFIALLRQTGGGLRAERMPGLDYVLAAMSRAGIFTLFVGPTAPVANQSTTVWLQPLSPSWIGESTVYLWNSSTNAYEPASPALWNALFTASAQVVQTVTVGGVTAVLANARIVRVAAGAPVTLTMPQAVNKVGDVLISDWNNLAGTNNITIQRSGADVFPNGRTSLLIAADDASYMLRPVSGGYVI